MDFMCWWWPLNGNMIRSNYKTYVQNKKLKMTFSSLKTKTPRKNNSRDLNKTDPATNNHSSTETKLES